MFQIKLNELEAFNEYDFICRLQIFPHLLLLHVSFAIAKEVVFIYLLTISDTFATEFDSNKISLYRLHLVSRQSSLVIRIAPYFAEMLCMILPLMYIELSKKSIVVRETVPIFTLYPKLFVGSVKTLHKFVAYFH